MPSYCYNHLVVRNITSKERFALLKKMRSDDSNWDINKIIPYPKKFREQDEEYFKIGKIENDREREKAKKEFRKKYGCDNNGEIKDGYNAGGYDWCCRRWGTKWGYCDVQIEEFPDAPDDEMVELVIDYQTAWCPAVPANEKLSRMFPNAVFEYYFTFESGEDDVHMEYRDGKITMYEQTPNSLFEDFDEIEEKSKNLKQIEALKK